MSWIFYISLSIFFFTLVGLFSRVLSTQSKNVRALTVAFNLISVGLAVILFILNKGVQNFSLPTHLSAYIFLAGGVLFYGLFERLRFQASKLVEASVLSLFTPISLVVAFGVSLLVYQEQFTFAKLISLVLISLAIFLISYSKKPKNLTKKGIRLAVLASVVVGLAMSFDKAGSVNFNPDTYNILLWLLPVGVVYFFPRVKTEKIISETKSAGWKLALLASFNVLAYFFLLKAFALAEATKVILTSQLTMIFIVLTGIIFLKERDRVWVKLVAAVIAFAGVALLVS